MRCNCLNFMISITFFFEVLPTAIFIWLAISISSVGWTGSHFLMQRNLPYGFIHVKALFQFSVFLVTSIFSSIQCSQLIAHWSLSHLEMFDLFFCWEIFAQDFRAFPGSSNLCPSVFCTFLLIVIFVFSSSRSVFLIAQISIDNLWSSDLYRFCLDFFGRSHVYQLLSSFCPVTCQLGVVGYFDCVRALKKFSPYHDEKAQVSLMEDPY